MTTPTGSAAEAEKTILGHPRGLFVLFFSELWERFSFYGMRALLTLYMVKVLSYTDETSAGVYGAYGALVYMFPVLGGWLAEKVLGYRRAVILGGSLMAIGHALMAIEHEMAFYCALAFLCIGNGFFKPNISSTVGKLYEPGDPRRDSGFTIFYIGINVGAMLAPWVCSPLQENFGWHWGFGAATFGMILGLAIFTYYKKTLQGKGEPQNPGMLTAKTIGIPNQPLIWIASLGAVPLVGLLLWQNDITGYLLYAAGIAVVVMMFKYAFAGDGTTRDRIFALMILMIFHMMFWAFFEQAGSSLTLFAERCVNRDMPIIGEQGAPWFQGVNPFFIIIFGPIFTMIWGSLAVRNIQPSIPVKFALGLLQLGIGFGVLVWGMKTAGPGERSSWVFLVFMYLFHTTGELCLSPVGLSAVTKLAPQHAVGFFMGAWFMTISFGHKIAGEIAKLTKVEFGEGTVLRALTAGAYNIGKENEGSALADLVHGESLKGALTIQEVVTKLGEKGVAPQQVLDHLTANGWVKPEVMSEIAGIIGRAEVATAKPAEVVASLNEHTIGPVLEIYEPIYQNVFYAAVALAVLLFLLAKPIKKLMHGVE